MKAFHSIWLAAVVGLGLVASGTAWAELYKWTDEEGNVTYSQVPPPDRKVTKIAPPPPPPQGTTPSARRDYLGSSDPNQVDPEEAKQKKDLAEIAKKNCDISKRNLEIYKTQRRIRTETGEVQDLDDKTRATKVAEAEKAVKTFCQ